MFLAFLELKLNLKAGGEKAVFSHKYISKKYIYVECVLDLMVVKKCESLF